MRVCTHVPGDKRQEDQNDDIAGADAKVVPMFSATRWRSVSRPMACACWLAILVFSLACARLSCHMLKVLLLLSGNQVHTAQFARAVWRRACRHGARQVATLRGSMPGIPPHADLSGRLLLDLGVARIPMAQPPTQGRVMEATWDIFCQAVPD